MVDIAAFRGLLYNPAKIGNLAEVITPPYDVISESEREQFYARNPYNIIRLILNKEENKYQQAAIYFKQWQQEEVLSRNGQPAIYAYSQEFSLDGVYKVRSGFFALAQLTESGTVHPHEHTLLKPKEDRLNLMRACEANFSPIFFLYQDKKQTVKNLLQEEIKKAPICDVEDDEKVRHKLWKITQTETIDRIITEMKKEQVYIADGHHRYEAALKFQQEKHQLHPGAKGLQPYDFVMAMFVAKNNEGLVILPTHRILKVPNFQPPDFFQKLSKFFSVEEVADKKTMLAKMSLAQGRHAFGIYLKSKFYCLTFQALSQIDQLIKEKQSPAWKALDVNILQKIIVEQILEVLPAAIEKEEGFAYTRDVEQAKQMVDSGNFDIAFFLNPTRIDQVIQVADAGEKMPQKSTFFYPKLITGLVINKLS